MSAKKAAKKVVKKAVKKIKSPDTSKMPEGLKKYWDAKASK